MSSGTLPPGAERGTDRDAGTDSSDAAPSDDAALLAAHVAGDPSAFAVIVARHRDRLWAVALRTTDDREEAADALQDAMVSAYRSAAGFRGEAAVTTWLHRVVVNACLDRMRRRRARPTVPLTDREPAQSRDEHALTDVRIDVRAALATLPEHQRQALVLVDMHAMSVTEAAEVLGVAQGTIKSRCARGRAALAPLLRPDGAATAARGNRDAPPVVPPGSARADRAGGQSPPAHTAALDRPSEHETTKDEGEGRWTT